MKYLIEENDMDIVLDALDSLHEDMRWNNKNEENHAHNNTNHHKAIHTPIYICIYKCKFRTKHRWLNFIPAPRRPRPSNMQISSNIVLKHGTVPISADIVQKR